MKSDTYLKSKVAKIESTLKDFFGGLGSRLLDLKLINSDMVPGIKSGIIDICKEGVLDAGGKRLRPVFTYLTHDLLKGSCEGIDEIAIMPELIHKGSVVIDDIQDQALLRDGKDPIYKKYGVPLAINSGNFLYFLPTLILQEQLASKPEMLDKIQQDYLFESTAAHIGQGMDIYWRENKIIPNEQDYLLMNAHKTSSFRSAIKLGAIVARATEEQISILANIAEMLGTAYQLKDDLLSLDASAHDYGDDIIEGKISLMTIRTFSHSDDGELLKAILSKGQKDQGDIEKAIEIMLTNGSIAYCEEMAKQLIAKARATLVSNFEKSDCRDVFEELLEFALMRKK